MTDQRSVSIISVLKRGLLIGLVTVIGCTNGPNSNVGPNGLRVTDAVGFKVDLDTMPAPISVPFFVETAKHVKAGNPTVSSSGREEFQPSYSARIKLNLDSLPKYEPKPTPSEPFIGKDVKSKPPILVEAKNPYVKDRNPQNFSTFGKLQGLMHANITSIIQDIDGNIWFGTYGGGVTRYDGYTFSHFNESHGISHSIVLCMLQDRQGNIWFGTGGGGVTFYDGHHFKHFALGGTANNDIVSCILEDNEGRIWFGTNTNGAVRYDGNSIERFGLGSGLGSNAILSLLKDTDGNIWFGTDGQGMARFDGSKFIRMGEGLHPSLKAITAFEQTSDGMLWIGTFGKGLFKFNGTELLYSEYLGQVDNANIATILEDRLGHVWIGSVFSGLTRFDGQNYVRFNEKDGLMMNSVRSLFEDQAGNMWLGTYGLGVSKYDGRLFTYYTETEGLANKVVCGIDEDSDGNVWLATGGGGVQMFDGNTFFTYAQKEGLNSNVMLSVCVAHDSSIWFGSLSNGVCRFANGEFTYFTAEDGLGGSDIRCLIEDRQGRMWFGINGGGVSCFDGQRFTVYTTRQGLASNSIRSLAEDSEGNIWCGTMGGGVSKFDGHSFITFNTENGLPNNDVLSIDQDRTGILWFGTNGGGVVRFDGERFVTLNEEDELTSNVVQSITHDKRGNVWFGTRFGISRFDATQQYLLDTKMKRTNSSSSGFGRTRFDQFTYDDGFIGVGVNGGRSLCEAKDGSIWIAANDRLAVYHPEGDVTDPNPPKVELTGVSLFNERIDWAALSAANDSSFQLSNGVIISDLAFDSVSRWYSVPQNLSLPYNNNYLTFNYIGITMNRPKQVRYCYKLEGMDAQWSVITQKTEATYGNLPHGNYTFTVKAMNSEGVWSEPIAYSFTIRPPWWLTWWAYAAYFTATVGSFFFYVKWRERGLRKRQRELELTVTERTAEVVHEKAIVEEKNKQIVDSITYAQRIQSTILPSERAFKLHLPDAFILYRPKDIVAGDFYWMELTEDGKIFLAACDCTGHGVPGAMVSVVCHNALNKSLHEFGCRTPATILDKTTELVADNLNRNMELNNAVKDGMDASVCSIDPDTGEFHWAGANNPLLLVKKGEELLEVKADKQAVGHSDSRNHYTDHSFRLESGDVFYLITDGFADQFGGPNNKKFQRAKLRELLFSIHHLPMAEQYKVVEETYVNWKGTHEQLDDITIIGVRFL